MARTQEVVTDGPHHHYGNRVSGIDGLLSCGRLDEVRTCQLPRGEMVTSESSGYHSTQRLCIEMSWCEASD